MVQQNYQVETTNSKKEPTPRRKSTVKRGNLSGESQGGREEFQPEETKDDAEARKEFWSTQGDFIYRHHIEPRVHLYVPKKNRSLFHWSTMMSSGQLIPIWTLHKKNELMTIGMSNLSVSWTGFTRFTLLIETPPRGYVVQGETDKIQTTSRPDHIWPDAWTRIGKGAQKREKQEWTIEKPKLEYARKLRGNYSIDPSDGEFEDIIKNARRKLETPMAAAMPCKRALSSSQHSGNRCFKNKKSQNVWSKDKIQLYCWSTWIHKTKSRVSDEKDY